MSAPHRSRGLRIGLSQFGEVDGLSHAKIPRKPRAIYDLFVAAPMAGFQDLARFSESRDTIRGMIDQLLDNGLAERVYYAGLEMGESANFTPSGDALEQDLGALQRSRGFLLIYPEKVATGALVELGYALALRIPTAILVQQFEDLPYFFREMHGRTTTSVSGPIAIVEYLGNSTLFPAAAKALTLLRS